MNNAPKILLVTDDTDWIDNIYNHLTHLNIQISIAENVAEATIYVKDKEFALALIYSKIKIQDITNLKNTLSSTEKNALLPVLIIKSSNSPKNHVSEYIQAGAVDVIDYKMIAHLLEAKVKLFLELFNQRKALETEIEQRKLTESKLRTIQSSLREAKNKAEESDNLKSAFLANMSHEIRTPMNAIIGFSNLLANENLTAKQRKQYGNYINNSSNTLLRLIDDILDIAKIEAGQLHISSTNIHLNSVFCELYKVFFDELKNLEKDNINLSLNIPGDNYYVQTDELRLRQVLTNLLSNAIKFTRNGEVTFGFYTEGERIIFFVQDTGVGIPKDKQDVIFKRFERIENHDLPNSTGTGLGLSISKKIVEMLGGGMWLESENGKGSTFYFAVPHKEISQSQVNKPLQSTYDNNQSIDWKDKLVLIAEDEILNFQFLRETLRKTGIRVMWARDGKEAIALARNNVHLDIILMDIKMPNVTGYEAMAAIKKILPNVPIIAQTAYAMSDEEENCLTAGFDGYLAKPIKSHKLYEKMGQLILNKKHHEATM
ncbi:MAG: response regulator [Bacteroidetes bacterium]|nr:response regulator [Bacteroidota bacterium]